MPIRSRIFKIASIVFVLIAVYHLSSIFVKTEHSSPTRHIVFVLINLIFSYLFWTKSKWLLLLYPILIIQQLMGHGKRLVNELAQNDFHYTDVFVVILLPLGLYLIVSDFLFSEKK